MILKVKVKANQPKNEIIKDKDFYVVYIKESPEKGRANLAVIKLFKRELKKDVRIISGFKSKEKLIEILS